MGKWVTFPPVISFFLLIPTVLFHNRENAYHVPSIIWGLVIAVYICMCGISIFFILKNERKYGACISALTQGMLLSVMALQSGAVLLSWVGMVLFLVGLFMAFYYTTKGGSELSAPKAETEKKEQVHSIEKTLSKMHLPVCYTDSKGVISWVSNSLLSELAMDSDKVIGENISDVIPIDEETVTLDSGTWWISQIKEGARYYFILEPTKEGKPAPAAPAGQISTPLGPSIFDPNSGLYTDEYRRMRGPEEVMRAQRYKRSLSGMLLELTFDVSEDVKISDEQKSMLNNAFAAKVKEALRVTDCGFLMDDNYRMQLLLPETPQAGAKTLMSRLLVLPQDVFDEDIRAAVNPKVKAGMFFYNGASRMEYGIFSATLEEAFAKAKNGAPGIGNAA